MSAGIGAMAMAAIIAGLWIAGLLPLREAAAPSNAAPPSAAATATAASQTPTGEQISARLDKIEHTIQARQAEPALGSRLAAGEAETKSLGDSLAALSRRLDDIAATSQSALKQADAAQATAAAAKSAGQAGVQRSDIDALANRIAALESAVKTLSEAVARRLASGADDRAARLTVAAEALRAAVERGAPYQAELTAVQSLGADPNATAPLVSFAASGVPSASALAHELAALTPALQRTSDAMRGEITFLGRLEANAQRLVRITPVDAPAGNDPSAVIARIAIDAARADIAAARADIAALPASATSLTADWVKQAELRDAAIAASRQIAAVALAALGKPAAQ